ncbi:MULTISPECIES: hypothetical protein [unclassified Streptomyces]|uniref:hypothetical protein n=1 Tax=unclassified Streptomyces TaxID=2593676 RepID=UPI0035E287D0
MPGQRKRKRGNARGRAWEADRSGHWDVVLETQDQAVFQHHVRRLRADPHLGDPSELRIDVLCGRLTHPTTYRLSRFVPSDAEH